MKKGKKTKAKTKTKEQRGDTSCSENAIAT